MIEPAWGGRGQDNTDDELPWIEDGDAWGNEEVSCLYRPHSTLAAYFDQSIQRQ